MKNSPNVSRLKLLTSLMILVCGLILTIDLSSPIAAQDAALTLIPPTLVPTQNPAVSDVLVSESAIARIQRDTKVRVGILFNEAPFGELNLRGEVSGFDADVARAMGEAWGVEVQFVQVTRQNSLDILKAGQVDFLMAAQVHYRELDSQVEFSQSYYRGSQSMMVRVDDGAAVLADMANRRVGVVIGTDSERVVAQWLQRAGITVTIQTYLTLDQAYAALVSNEVDGIVDSRFQLTQVAAQPDLVRVLDQTVAPEPYAVVMLRQDVNMRNLVNRTLQYLSQSGKLDEIHKIYFTGSAYPIGTIPLWANVGEEAPTPSQFPSEITYPAQYTTPRVLNDKVVRVAGLSSVPEDAPESVRRFELLNRELIERMAEKWGARVEYIPDSASNALDLVASGQADIAVGVQPDWASADRVDFTLPYLLHGERLMVPVDSPVQSFQDLRGGKWVAVANNELQMDERAVELATSVNSRIEVYQTREQDLALAILEEENADVAFGDSLKLIPHVQAYSADLKLMQREPDSWYSRLYVAFAVPRNDIDFRLLVDYTLQELIRDGTLNTLLQPVMLTEEIPQFDIWPGSSDYLGLSLGS